jgi:hypothetical protein
MKAVQWIKILSLVFWVFSFSSCEKVIQLKLKQEEQRLVIEGVLTKGDSTHRVKVTKTLNFDQTIEYPAVDNAIVVVTDDIGNTGVFNYIGNGYYEVQNYVAFVGRTYTLKVTHDGITYEAKSTIPSEVLLEGIPVVTYQVGTMSVKLPIPLWVDIANEKNYYQYDVYQNSEKLKGIRLADDMYTDGLENEQPLNIFGLEPGDTLRVVFHCIDYSAHNYLFTLEQNTGSVAAPADPGSNFGSNALGYFTARVTSEKTIIIP